MEEGGEITGYRPRDDRRIGGGGRDNSDASSSILDARSFVRCSRIIIRFLSRERSKKIEIIDSNEEKERERNLN